MNMEDGESAHAARKRHEEELKKKSQEAIEAGKQTAHGAVREGQQGYEDAKVSFSNTSLRTVIVTSLANRISYLHRHQAKPN